MAQKATEHRGQANVAFLPTGQAAQVEIGTLLADAAVRAGVVLNLPCGGQGRCGRCRVRIERGAISHRSGARISPKDEAEGWVLGCQAVVKGDAVVFVPEQDKTDIEFAAKPAGAERIALAAEYAGEIDPSILGVHLSIAPPSLADQTTDWDRLKRELAVQHGIHNVTCGLPSLRTLSRDLREAEWNVTAVLDLGDPILSPGLGPRLVDVLPGDQSDRSYGVAIDIGTTSNVIYLVDLKKGRVLDRASAYNAQISVGEDVISRIVFSQTRDGLQRLQKLVLKTLNGLLEELTTRNQIPNREITKAVVAGNTTMIQMFLELDSRYIREMPYIPTLSQPIPVTAEEIGLNISPQATIDCLPVVGAAAEAGTMDRTPVPEPSAAAGTGEELAALPAEPATDFAASVPAATPAPTGAFVVQAGAFKQPATAEGVVAKLRDVGIAAQIETTQAAAGTLHRVVVPGFADRAAAAALVARLKQELGIDAVVRTP